MTLRLLLAAVLAAALLPLPARADDTWHVVSVNGRDYVPLKDFCKFYGYGYPGTADGKFFTVTGQKNAGRGDLRFEKDSTRIYLDGVCAYLSFPVLASDPDWLVSRLDLAYFFEPVLRPDKISDRRPFKGVVIDAGHGGTDNGASSTRGYEKTYTLDTAFRLRRLLQADDIPVVLTRTTDDFVQLEERAHFGDRYTDFLFVSIHFNSATPQARGIETYVCTPRGAASTSSEGELRQSDFQRENGNGEDALNALLGHLVHDEVVKLNPGDIEADRGFKRARFVVLRENSLPSLLVEGGFLTNRIESAAIDQGAYRQKLAQAIDDGIDAFLRATGSPIAPAVVKPAVPVAPPAAPPAPAAQTPAQTGPAPTPPSDAPVNIYPTSPTLKSPPPATGPDSTGPAPSPSDKQP